MSTAALAIAFAALWVTAAAVIWNRACTSFRRAARLYTACRFAEGKAEMRRGRALRRRADRMVLRLMPPRS